MLCAKASAQDDSNEEWRRENSWELMASQSHQPTSSRFSEENLLKIIQGKAMLISGLPIYIHMNTHASVHARAHVYALTHTQSCIQHKNQKTGTDHNKPHVVRWRCGSEGDSSQQCAL